jgi:hypothetical protein
LRALVLVVAILLAAACGPGRAPGAYDPNAIRVCIENITVGYGDLVAMVGTTRFRVSPSDEVCRNVRATAGGLPIRAQTTSGGGTGPLRYAFTLPGGTYCWHWRVSSAPTLDVVSCDQGLGY